MEKKSQKFSITQTAEILVPDKVGRVSYLYALGITIIMIVVISVMYLKLPDNLPLYFSLPWGEGRLAPRIAMFLLPVITILFLLLNILLGRLASKLSPLLPRVLAVASLVVAAMMMIAIMGIVQSLIL